MPNWCMNEIEVWGKNKSLRKLMDTIRNEDCDFDFNKISPYPANYIEQDNKVEGQFDGYNNGGHQWCLKNWGTKWNASEPSVSIGVKYLMMSFDTAYTPSLPVTGKLSKLFPDLKFKHSYEEEGCDFSGYRVMKEGEVIREADGDYDAFPITDHIYEEG